MKVFTRYTDFLNDTEFIRWQFTSDINLENFWSNFIIQNPCLESEMHKAIDYLKTTGLNKPIMSDMDKSILLQRIETSIAIDKKRKKRGRIVTLGISQVAAVVLILLVLNSLFSNKEQSIYNFSEDVILGSELKSEDIQLISNNKSRTFNENVDIDVTSDGKARVRKESDSLGYDNIEVDKNSLNTLVVPYGKRTTLTLADGSKVWLNSGTILEFPAHFSGNSREVRLASGEMYIEVVHDKKKQFIVRSKGFDVKVYGTIFNIAAYPDTNQSVLVLVDGSVGLSREDKDEIHIKPNEQVIISNDGEINTRVVNVDYFISWQKGYLEFNKTPMLEVLSKISRYYNLEFDFDNDVNLQNRSCTGKIFLSEKLDNVMSTISLLANLKYTKEGETILITNK